MVWYLPEVVTRADSMQILDQGCEKIVEGEYIFDARALKQFDSTVLAMLLAWKREAEKQGKSRLIIQSLPEKLAGLSQVYGITELLQL